MENARNKYGVDMTPEQAVEYRNAWFDEYDGIVEWHNQARRDARNPDITEVRTRGIGRRRLLPPAQWKNNWKRFTDLVNGVVQGSCAEAVKLAMLEIAELLAGTTAYLVNTVHDELIIEADAEEAAVIRDNVVEIMQRHFYDIFRVPVAVEAAVADNWSEKK